MYTFLPIEEPSPLTAHVHAPFFTNLARREVSLEVPLNDHLMGEIAAAWLELLRTQRPTWRARTPFPGRLRARACLSNQILVCRALSYLLVPPDDPCCSLSRDGRAMAIVSWPKCRRI